MTLLSPLALLFGVTALVPLILHLYQRRRRTVIEFSTNRFFTKTIIRSQRRLRLRRLLLLLLRMATCVLLALALARPIVHLMGWGHGGSRDLVILLDDSLSMQAVDGALVDPGGGESRFVQARRIALDVLAELSAGDRAAIVTFAGRDIGERVREGVTLTGDVLGLAGELRQLRPTAAAGDAHAALARAAKALEGPGGRQRLLLLLSDLQETDWQQCEWPQPAEPVEVAVVTLRPPTNRNVAADQMVLSEGTAVAGQPNLLRVRLVNYGPETTNAQMVLRVDGVEHGRWPVELPGRGPHVERIPLILTEPGVHRLRLDIETRDGMAEDNTLFAALTVSPQISVLVVDGESHARGHQSAAFYLQAALRSIGADGDGVVIDTVSPGDLPAVAMDGYRVVVLSGVDELPLQQVERFESLVQEGGGLAVFLGEGADREFYNGLLGGKTRPLGGLLPAELRDVLSTEGAAHPLHLAAADLDHPMFQRFKGSLRGALGGISVYRAHATVPREAWIVAQLDQGLPLIVERSYGQGRVMLWTVPPHPSWTNLPLRRTFLPLVSRMTSYLAGGGARAAQHAVGQRLVLLRGGWDLDQPVRVRRPDGTRVRAAVKVIGAEPVAALPAVLVDQAGFYELDVQLDGHSGKPGRNVFAVNAPRSESVPYTVDLDAAKDLTGRWQVAVVEDREMADGALTAMLTGSLAGRSIWDALLWTVLALAILEPLLANRIRRARTRDTTQRVQEAA